MGASGWDYIVAYQPDIEYALHQLQADIFKQEIYHHVHGVAVPPEEHHPLTALAIADLRQRAGMRGTHSILDMTGISVVVCESKVSPLTEEQLRELFGTTTPTRAEVEEVQHEARRNGVWLFDFDEDFRDFGYYIIMYRHAKPHEILFTGMSGD